MNTEFFYIKLISLYEQKQMMNQVSWLHKDYVDWGFLNLTKTLASIRPRARTPVYPL